MQRRAREALSDLGLMTIQNIGQAVETLQQRGFVARPEEPRHLIDLLASATCAMGVDVPLDPVMRRRAI